MRIKDKISKDIFAVKKEKKFCCDTHTSFSYPTLQHMNILLSVTFIFNIFFLCLIVDELLAFIIFVYNFPYFAGVWLHSSNYYQ